MPSKIELLTERHSLDGFSCGKPSLDAWLARFAQSNQQHGFTRVFVICDGDAVVGYYGLAPTVIAPNVVTRKVRSGQPPDPIPCLLIGQLAVDQRYGGRGIGTALVRDAFQRCSAGADLVGGRAIVVRAIDEEAELYWQNWGFIPSRDNPSILVRSLNDIRTWLRSDS
ncbi:N-acetyltransferase [Rhizobium leguminosarum]|uniref:N-acetyltransferase n=1 Tax=Rhizobium beringeri TaxID=3019934 RepID=A0ABY1XHD4_9HYPH|nr:MULTISPECIES: GNAT family N-acetyltransferase [Rhizobium]TBC54618.1 N-acetyltransferase [Rhizobium leguminosarum]TBE57950.1 N-acetyltransferase [Rhizobium beringeri]